MKRWTRHPGSAAAVLFLCASILAFAAPGRADVLINEILADPAVDWDGDGEANYLGDEWIEVVNNGTEVEDLAEYWLRDGLGDLPHLKLDGLLAPGEVKVYYGSQAAAWQVENGAGATGFSLNNTGDTVELLKSHYIDGNLMSLDVVHGITYADHEAEDDRSSGWGFDSGGWELFDGLNPYDGPESPAGSGCVPTPGALNVCDPFLASQPMSLGGVKALYR